MARYSYIGLDAHRREVRGQIEADSPRAAARILRGQSISILEIREGKSPMRNRGLRAKIKCFLGWINPANLMPVTTGVLIVFFRQLVLMLRSGHTLVSSLESAGEMQTRSGFVRAIGGMGDELRRGARLSACLVGAKKFFSPMIVSLVAVGEKTGNLDAILDRVADDLERRKELKRQLLSAMFYPMVVLLAAVGVIVFLVVWAIPRFAVFLTARNSALPASTQLLLNVGEWLLVHGPVICTTLAVATFAILAAYTTRVGKMAVDRGVLWIPLIGTAVQFGAMAQAGWQLSMCLRSGIPLLDSLRINGSAMGNLAMARSFDRAADDVLQGRPLSKAFEQAHFPVMVRNMAAVGEASGELDKVLDDMGGYYQKELEAKVRFMSVVVEPAMILVMGSLVGFVYYSMFQAILAASKGGI